MVIDYQSYTIAFALTVVVELAVARLLGFRTTSEIAAVVSVNVFSHPLLHYVFWCIASTRSTPVSAMEIPLFEAGVVLVEWQLLCFALGWQGRWRLFRLSLAMNGASYLVGMLLPV